MTTGGATAVLDRNGLNALVAELNADGRTVVGPTVRDGAIVLAELDSADQLPYGWGVELEAGHYRLRRREDGAAFAHSAGPQSWKNFLHPQREKLWSADRAPDGTVAISTETADRPSYAFLGVRPCDLRAIAIQDQVLTGGHFRDSGYEERRRGAFLIAAECTEPGATCFCVSMGGGPGADAGFDLALTEVVDQAGQRFFVRVGSEAGAELLAKLPHREADATTRGAAVAAVSDAVDKMGRAMPPVSLQQLMGSSLDAERRQRWDSCFDLDFSYVHGGPVCSSGRSRCIVWCPVGIDITEEVTALQAEAGARNEEAER
ncbi:4Fe-4S ferredoxin [Streptomyces sp. NBC_01381]|uniref:4Fe-4S ferredoxin n=1 Tax=Streptomyces sp. NBC_01381 TaxID=2903845 RepID=UPI00225A28E1|nr:4Fe-4S ferredoxin [Streptomyces sp. NBC_01381]MCX4673718.1 4Fe-4S ferredoxin [Streptomyces sp. NBC_01381]